MAEWFRRQRNMGRLGSVMRAVLCLCSFCGWVVEATAKSETSRLMRVQCCVYAVFGRWSWEENPGRKDGWHRRVAQTDGPGRKSLFGRNLRFDVFSSQGHPSVPFVLALPVSETDGAETDAPETEEGRSRRMSPRRRKAARDWCPRDGGRLPETDVPETDVPETAGVFFRA